MSWNSTTNKATYIKSPFEKWPLKSQFEKWPRAKLRSARPDVDIAKVQQRQTGPRPRGSSVISTRREYKSKLISMNSIHRYLRIPATCTWSDDVSRTSVLCKQGAGRELRLHACAASTCIVTISQLITEFTTTHYSKHFK